MQVEWEESPEFSLLSLVDSYRQEFITLSQQQEEAIKWEKLVQLKQWPASGELEEVDFESSDIRLDQQRIIEEVKKKKKKKTKTKKII